MTAHDARKNTDAIVHLIELAQSTASGTRNRARTELQT